MVARLELGEKAPDAAAAHLAERLRRAGRDDELGPSGIERLVVSTDGDLYGPVCPGSSRAGRRHPDDPYERAQESNK